MARAVLLVLLAAAAIAGADGSVAPDGAPAARHRSPECSDRIAKLRARLAPRGVVAQAADGAVTIRVRDQMGSNFAPIMAYLTVDDQELYARCGDEGGSREGEVFRGALLPGAHAVRVLAIYQGVGHGIFNYLNRYSFNVKASHELSVIAGHTVELTITAYEKSAGDIKDRPAISFTVK